MIHQVGDRSEQAGIWAQYSIWAWLDLPFRTLSTAPLHFVVGSFSDC